MKLDITIKLRKTLSPYYHKNEIKSRSFLISGGEFYRPCQHHFDLKSDFVWWYSHFQCIYMWMAIITRRATPVQLCMSNQVCRCQIKVNSGPGNPPPLRPWGNTSQRTNPDKTSTKKATKAKTASVNKNLALDMKHHPETFDVIIPPEARGQIFKSSTAHHSQVRSRIPFFFLLSLTSFL